jgi:hypothetical protein
METIILFFLREEILKAVCLKLRFLLLKAVREDWTTLILCFETLLSEELSNFFLFHGAYSKLIGSSSLLAQALLAPQGTFCSIDLVT